MDNTFFFKFAFLFQLANFSKDSFNLMTDQQIPQSREKKKNFRNPFKINIFIASSLFDEHKEKSTETNQWLFWKPKWFVSQLELWGHSVETMSFINENSIKVI